MMITTMLHADDDDNNNADDDHDDFIATASRNDVEDNEKNLVANDVDFENDKSIITMWLLLMIITAPFTRVCHFSI